MPWSAKAQALLREQYAATGAVATAGLGEAVELLEKARRSGLQIDDLLADFMQRKTRADQYVEAYRRYCWPLTSWTIADLRRSISLPVRAICTWTAITSGTCSSLRRLRLKVALV